MRAPNADLACGLAGAVGMLAAVPDMPVVVRVLLGVPLVLFLPGFAAVRAVLPPWSPLRPETLLAALGAALALSVCAATLLAVTVGLSGQALALTLGAVTVAAAGTARFRRVRHPAKHLRTPWRERLPPKHVGRPWLGR